MDKTQVYQQLKQHAEASKASGAPDIEVENALKAFEAKNGGMAQNTPSMPAQPIQTQPQPSQTPAQPDIASLIKGIQPSGGQSIANAMSVLGGGKPVYDTGGDELSKIYLQQAVKDQFEKPKVVALGVDDKGQPIWGYPPKGFDVAGSTTVLGQKKGFDAEAFNEGDEEQIDESQPQTIQTEPVQQPAQQNTMTQAQLLQMKQQALSEGRDPQQVEAIYQEELAKLGQGQEQPDEFGVAGDATQLNIDDSDAQYLLAQGFDPELIQNILQKSQKKKIGAINV